VRLVDRQKNLMKRERNEDNCIPPHERKNKVKNYCSKTNYAIKMLEIWNSSKSRQEAHVRIQDQLDENLSYAKMMSKINYAIKSGIQVEGVPRDATDWSTVKNHFDGEGSSEDAFETEE